MKKSNNETFHKIIIDNDVEGLLKMSNENKEDFLLILMYDYLCNKKLSEMNQVQKTLYLAMRLEDICQTDALPSLSEDEEIFLALPEIKLAYERLGALKTAQYLNEFIALIPKATIPEWDWFFDDERKQIIHRLDSKICNYPDGLMKNLYITYISNCENANKLLNNLA